MNSQRNLPQHPIIHRMTTYSALVLIFLMCLTFTACERIQQVVVPGEQPTVSPSDSAETIKIGMLYSLPAPGTTLSGAELAVSEFNVAGGINGIPITLIAKDDGNDAERSAELAKELIAEGVMGIVGPDWDPQSWAVGPLAQTAQIPMVTTYPTNPNNPDAGDFVFMSAYTDNYQGELIAKFALESLAAETAAILSEQSTAYTGVYAEGLREFFTNNFTAGGGTIVVQQFYEKDATDFTAQLTAIAAASPDVVFVPGFMPEVARIIRQGKAELGMTATFLGGDGWDNPQLIPVGGAALEGSFFVNHFAAQPAENLKTEEARQFVAAYTAMFGVPPDGPASLGYDAVRIMVQAMRRAKTLTGPAIRDEIAATMNYNGASTIARYDENRYAIKSGVINTITAGVIQLHQVIAP